MLPSAFSESFFFVLMIQMRSSTTQSNSCLIKDVVKDLDSLSYRCTERPLKQPAY